MHEWVYSDISGVIEIFLEEVERYVIYVSRAVSSARGAAAHFWNPLRSRATVWVNSTQPNISWVVVITKHQKNQKFYEKTFLINIEKKTKPESSFPTTKDDQKGKL